MSEEITAMSDQEQDRYNMICKQEFNRLNNKLDKLDTAIRGNGKPGLQSRMASLEGSMKNIVKFLWMLLGAIVSVAAFTVRSFFV